MTQKVIKIGSSVGMTFPKYLLKMLGISVGDHINVEVNMQKKVITVSPSDSSKKAATELDAELAEWTDEFIERYRPALEVLKNA